MKFKLKIFAAALIMTTASVNAQFPGYTNQGLIGVGRLSGNSFDQLGPNVDSLGGVGSSVVIDQSSLLRTGDEVNGFSYSGIFYGVADRGFGSGSQDFHSRLQTFGFVVTPYYGSGPTNQSQIAFANLATTLLTYGGTNFTGFEPNDPLATIWPQSPTNSLGQGRRSLDPEGLVRAADGSWFIADEYGPSILRFDASGAVQSRFTLPGAFIPKRGNFPGVNAFASTNVLTSGRIKNKGFEGLTLTPDGKRLVAALQDPLQQDGNANALSRNTRLLFFDVDTNSPTQGRMVAEYVYQVTLNNSPTTNKQTAISEIMALNNETFLVMERDSNGLGDGTNAGPLYKSVVLANTRGATNIANTGYDLEKGAPNAVSLPTNTALVAIAPVARQDLVAIVNSNELARFDLNLSPNRTTNTLCEKWEGLGLVPLVDPAAPNDFLLLVFNDNDFNATTVYHNGVIVGTNALTIDNMILAYRVTLPGVGAAAPANSAPGLTLTGPTNTTWSAPADFTLTASAYDQDGIVTNVEFFKGGVKIGEDTTFPFQLALTGVAAGSYSYTAVASDNSGASVTSAARVVTATVDNLLPNVTLSGPTNSTLSAPATVALVATASDPDGTVMKVEFYDNATKVGQKTSAPYSLTLSNVPAGMHTYTAVAIDNQAATNTSSALVVNVTAENIAASVTLLTPTNNFTATQTVHIAFSASASDPDGFITKVEYYRGATKLGQATAAPYSFTASNFVAGTNLVYALAYDNQGTTTASADATVIVFDRTAPVINCSSNRLVSCASTNGTPVNFTVTATDNNDSSVTVVCNPASGSLFSPGTNVVVCMATDAAGNTSSCSFNVIVLPSLVAIERAIILRWNCGEVLQSADNATGPWLDIPGATSPHAVPASEARRFYRVRN